MGVLLGYLISVGGFALVALVAAAVALLRPASVDRRLLAAVVLVYAALSIRAVPWVLSRPLALGYRQFSASDAAPRTPIVLLGAGNFTVHGRQGRLAVLDLAGAARVLEAARVYRLLGQPTIFSSGGAAPGFEMEPVALTMRKALVDVGVPREKIVLEAQSADTHEQAMVLAPMLREAGVGRCVLVTSDIHMRRALATFRAAGLEPVPAIAEDPLNSQSRFLTFAPTTDGLRFSSFVAHEYVGLAYYAARGWLSYQTKN
jgi:uncharacterized SAM-binding protein YcdF (DUF218 family)